jgi:hypothetical protein
MIRAVGILASVLVAAALCAAGAVELARRRDFILPILVAAGICLLPAMLTLLYALRNPPQTTVAQFQQLTMSMMVRMGLTAGGGLAAYFANEIFQTLVFLVALLGFYMLALAVETRLLIASQSKQAGNTGN